MSRVTQARRDVNQTPSMLRLHQSLGLKPTLGNHTAAVPRTRLAVYPTDKSGRQRVCFKGISFCGFLFFSPNIMKKSFDKSKSLG